MKTVDQITEQDLELLSQEIMAASDSMSENDLYEVVGASLHNLGLAADSHNGQASLQSKAFVPRARSVAEQPSMESELAGSVSFVRSFAPLSQEEAKEEGKKFWGRFKDRLKEAICTNEDLVSLMTGKGTLKQYLLTGIPLVMVALGMATINPVLMAIVVSVLALIVKVGFEAYCELPKG